MDQTAHNLQQQTELYGEPLGELVRRLAGPLGLTQGGVAQVIGLSAPMLSQLMSGQRVKIGNPAVVSRLQALDELADLAVRGELNPDDIPYELDQIRGATGAFTRSTPTGSLSRPAGDPAAGPIPFATPPGLGGQSPGWPGPAYARAAEPAGGSSASTSPSARAVVREIQDLFRAVASAEEIQRAAQAVAAESPGLAELLLVYGTGRTGDALAHFEKHHG